MNSTSSGSSSSRTDVLTKSTTKRSRPLYDVTPVSSAAIAPDARRRPAGQPSQSGRPAFACVHQLTSIVARNRTCEQLRRLVVGERELFVGQFQQLTGQAQLGERCRVE